MAIRKLLCGILPQRRSALKEVKVLPTTHITAAALKFELDSLQLMIAELDGYISVKTIETYISLHHTITTEHNPKNFTYFLPGVDSYLKKISQLAARSKATTASLLQHNAEQHTKKAIIDGLQPSQHLVKVEFVVFVLDLGTRLSPRPVTFLADPSHNEVMVNDSSREGLSGYTHRERAVFNKIVTPLVRIICFQPGLSSLWTEAGQKTWEFGELRETRHARNIDGGVFAADNALRMSKQQLPFTVEGSKPQRVGAALQLRVQMRYIFETAVEKIAASELSTRSEQILSLAIHAYDFKDFATARSTISRSALKASSSGETADQEHGKNKQVRFSGVQGTDQAQVTDKAAETESKSPGHDYGTSEARINRTGNYAAWRRRGRRQQVRYQTVR